MQYAHVCPFRYVSHACTVHADERQPSMRVIYSTPRYPKAAHKCSVVLTSVRRTPHLGDALPLTSASASCTIACASLTFPGSPPPAALTCLCTCLPQQHSWDSQPRKQERSIPWLPRVHRRAGPKGEALSMHKGEPGWPPLKMRLRRRPCAYRSTPASTRCRSVAVGVPSLHTTVQHIKGAAAASVQASAEGRMACIGGQPQQRIAQHKAHVARHIAWQEGPAVRRQFSLGDKAQEHACTGSLVAR